MNGTVDRHYSIWQYATTFVIVMNFSSRFCSTIHFLSMWRKLKTWSQEILCLCQEFIIIQNVGTFKHLSAYTKLKVTKLFVEVNVLIFTKLHEKSCCNLLIIYMKNASQIVMMDKILAACVLFVICTHVTILHSCYMKNALVFSQSDTLYLSCILLTLTVISLILN